MRKVGEKGLGWPEVTGRTAATQITRLYIHADKKSISQLTMHQASWWMSFNSSRPSSGSQIKFDSRVPLVSSFDLDLGVIFERGEVATAVQVKEASQQMESKSKVQFTTLRCVGANAR